MVNLIFLRQVFTIGVSPVALPIINSQVVEVWRIVLERFDNLD